MKTGPAGWPAGQPDRTSRPRRLDLAPAGPAFAALATSSGRPIQPTGMTAARCSLNSAPRLCGPRSDSWWVGANIPGMARTIYPYLGGVGTFRTICHEVAEKGYEGLVLSRHEG